MKNLEDPQLEFDLLVGNKSSSYSPKSPLLEEFESQKRLKVTVQVLDTELPTEGSTKISSMKSETLNLPKQDEPKDGSDSGSCNSKNSSRLLQIAQDSRLGPLSRLKSEQPSQNQSLLARRISDRGFMLGESKKDLDQASDTNSASAQEHDDTSPFKRSLTISIGNSRTRGLSMNPDKNQVLFIPAIESPRTKLATGQYDLLISDIVS